MADRSWMEYTIPRGKHKGDTLGMVRISDLSYIDWFSRQEKGNDAESNEIIDKCNECVEYLNKVDPFALAHMRDTGGKRGYR
jgi:hypothetical protein